VAPVTTTRQTTRPRAPRRPSHAFQPAQRDPVSDPDPRPPYARAPIYAAGSIHDPVYDKHGNAIRRPAPQIVGYLNGWGEREPLVWTWGDPCPRCTGPTEFGYCLRDTWVCDNAARPAPEPILSGAQRQHEIAAAAAEGLAP